MDLVLSPSFRSALVNDAIEAAERKKKTKNRGLNRVEKKRGLRSGHVTRPKPPSIFHPAATVVPSTIVLCFLY